MFSTTISSLLLLSSGVFSAPVYISDVKASREAGHLRVEVTGDGGIDPEGASTVIDDGRLVIYLGGTRVRADNRSWNLRDGAGEIRAHRHRSQTELVVPVAGNGCSGPVELMGTDTGITALVGCDGSAPATKTEAVRPVPKMPRKTPVDIAKLKQLIELPSTPPKPAPSAASSVEVGVVGTAAPILKTAASERAPAPRAIVAVTPSPASPPPLDRVEAAKPASRPAALVAGTPAQPSIAVAPISAGEGASPGSLRAVAVPAVLLAALAAVAYWLSRRRRGTVQRHIQILETTSLGPKRSLICARIGEETVILSSSEAGIMLLKGGASSTVTAAVEATLASNSVAALAISAGASAHLKSAARSAALETETDDAAIEIDQPLEEALADIPDPTGPVAVPLRASFRAIEGGLAGLFGKPDGGGSDGEDSADRFEDLLEDSLEDQELRQKLAAGMSARVR